MDYNNKIDSREITFLGKKVQLSYNAPCFWDLCLLLWLIERKVASYFLLLAFEFLLVEPRPGPSRAAHCPCRLTSPRCWCASLSLSAGSQVLEAGFCVCVCVCLRATVTPRAPLNARVLRRVLSCNASRVRDQLVNHWSALCCGAIVLPRERGL